MVDFFKYSGQQTEIPQYDFGRGFRALAQQQLNEARLAEDARQANMSEKGTQSRHADNLGFQRENLDSTNDRFAVGVADEERTKAYEAKLAKKKQADTMLKEFNNLVAKTDFSRADAMLGQLQSAGFKIDRRQGPDGMPIYRAEPPEFNEGLGEINSSGIRSQIGSGDVGASVRPTQQPQKEELFTEKNPFESLPGSSAASEPSVADSQGSDEFQAPPQPEANAIFTPPTGEQPTAPVAEAKNPFDPYELNTSQMKAQNQARMDPMLRGLIGATPGRYQGNMGAFAAGAREMGLPLEETMETMQKPMDTVAGLWRGEMGANAAMARASMSQGSQESNRDLRIIGMTRQFLNKVSQDYDLPKAKQDYEAIDGIIQRLDARNPQDDKAVLHDIRNLSQKGVATQPDIDAIEQGNRTLWSKGYNAILENLIVNGMNESAREGLKQALTLMKNNRNERLQKGAGQIMNSVYTADNGTEQMAGLQFMAAQIPQSLWPEEVKEFFAQQGGLGKPKANTHIGQRSSASVAVPVESSEPEDELEGLINGN